MKTTSFRVIVILFVVLLVLSAIGMTLFFTEYNQDDKKGKAEEDLPEGVKRIEKHFLFSDPEISENEETLNIYIEEADFNGIHDQWPILPVKIKTISFPFGTKIIDVEVEHTKPQNISLSKMVSYGSCSTKTEESEQIYKSEDFFPSNVVSYHMGAGLSNGSHQTFLVLRMNPVRYAPALNMATFVDHIDVKITYEEPDSPLFDEVDEYDLLIIAPNDFVRGLQDLIDYKNQKGIKTEIATVEQIKKESNGRDVQEKIKYFIKQEIENTGIEYVLLVGGIDGQSTNWNLPVRYSHVLIREGTQEIIEPAFISDLYYADIYDASGNFSSWDSNNNDVFAEYDDGIIDEMDLYPDVKLGRLPCRNKREVRIIVDKITTYEQQTKNSAWFKNLLLVSGDHWDDKAGISEGILIMKRAAEILHDFHAVELYATESDTLLTRDIRKAFNQGAGFAYFCGHGGISAWGIHYPPDASGWAPSLTQLRKITFYKNIHMDLLRNRDKLPVTLVGGCNNGQYDVSIMNRLKKGKLTFTTHCWAWHLTIQRKGGSIATIANTGLGTHAMDDNDRNGVNDYLEIYDGWLELRFLELFKQHGLDMLGETKQEAIKQYLHSFLGAGDEMDMKMVQQWQLFGDPSLKIGGY